MIPEVNSDRFENSNRFEMSFSLHGNLHGDFTVVTFQTIASLFRNFISLRAFTLYMENSLRFEISLWSI